MDDPELIPLLGARCVRVSEPGAEGILARLIKETTMSESHSSVISGAGQLGHLDFRFGLFDRVKLSESGEQGIVIGRAEYTTSEHSYLVRYRAGDGRQTECWWGESALVAAED